MTETTKQITKKNPTIGCLQDAHFKYENKGKMTINDQERYTMQIGSLRKVE